MNPRGFSLVEVLVSVSIILVLAISIASLFQFSGALAKRSLNKVVAVNLAEEGLEVARVWRDNGFTTQITAKTNNTSYYLLFATTTATWQATTTLTWSLERFARCVTFLPVYRDTNADIISSGGTLDPNSRLVTATVSWLEGQATTSYALSALITNQFSD